MLYDYSLVKPKDIQGVNSKIKIICKKCENQFKQRIDNHINQKQSCPNCNKNI